MINISQLNRKKNKQVKLPKESEPLSASEKLMKEEIQRLNENAKEIERLKEQLGHAKDIKSEEKE